MSENDPKNRRRPLKNLPPERFQPKVLLIWLAIVAAVLALFFLNPGKVKAPAQLNLQRVVELAEAGQIREGLIRPDTSGGRDWVVVSGETTEAVLTSDSGKTAFFRASGRLTDTNLEKLQKSQKFTEQPATTLLAQIASQIIPFLLIIGLLYFLFIRQLRNAGRGAMNFGKSRAKLLTRDRDRITFAEVAGCDEAKEEVAEVVEFLKDPKKFQRLGGRVPKGVLLMGPPGTGKTLLARAVAGEAGVPFFSISGSEFIQMFVGVGASRVRDLFKTAKDASPAILFIDEIDAVGRVRGAGLGGGHDEREQTLNQILSEMDGFSPSESVIVLAATNRPDVLDPALLRPGRFDRHVTVDRPNQKARLALFKVHTRNVPLAPDVDLERQASGTVGLTGADIRNLVNEAALWATRHDKDAVDSSDFDYARDKVLMGPKREELLTGREKKMTAYHEAGHALAAWLLPGVDKLHKVTIIPRGRALGVTQLVPEEDRMNIGESDLNNRLAFILAGRAAEKLVFGEYSAGAENDLQQATRIARKMVSHWGMSERVGPVACHGSNEQPFLGRDVYEQREYGEHTAQIIDEEVSRLLAEAAVRASALLSEQRGKLDRLAGELEAREMLDDTEVVEIIGPATPRSGGDASGPAQAAAAQTAPQPGVL